MTTAETPVDDIDVRLIALLTHTPRISMLDLSRRLHVARGTAQARLDRLLRLGIITDLAPTIDVTALGYPVMAFVTLEVKQHERHDDLSAHLADNPHVLEAHTITGRGDVLVRVVARSNVHVQSVIDNINAHPAVLRTSTVIALSEKVSPRVLPLVERCSPDAATTD